VNVVDLVLVVGMIVFAVIGWKRGFLYGIFGLVGFLIGAGIGLWLTPLVVGGWEPGIGRAVVAVVLVFVCAIVGQVGIGWFGKRLKEAVTWAPAAMLDSTLGAILSVVSMLLVVWLVASVAVPSGRNPIGHAVRNSTILGLVDYVVPDSAANATGQIQSLVDNAGFPAVFAGLAPEPVRAVAKPDAAIVRRQGVVEAAANTVKITGVAVGCDRGLEGSGFAFAPQRVITNAHVVAAVDHPTVFMGDDNRGYAARVIYFDPREDIAVLDVPDLPAQPLPIGLDVERGQNVAVVGYPNDGPLTADAARVRNVILARGHDIYGSGSVVREVISMRVEVHPGNSGGPVLDAAGKVVGVVFAASADDADTGYAMTMKQVSDAIAAGVSATEAVDTGSCA
jgi:S1-C subfamily serine protease